jgi:hypothetical protein
MRHFVSSWKFDLLMLVPGVMAISTLHAPDYTATFDQLIGDDSKKCLLCG